MAEVAGCESTYRQYPCEKPAGHHGPHSSADGRVAWSGPMPKRLSMAERVRRGLLKPNVAFDCEVCADRVEKYVPPSEIAKGKARNRFCSRTCKGIALSGPNHPMWRGGRAKTDQGYMLVHRPDHHEASSRGGYVREHRLVMEHHIGRSLHPEEVVHHDNDNPADNRIENLRLFADQAAHKAYEDRQRRRDERGRYLPRGESS